MFTLVMPHSVGGGWGLLLETTRDNRLVSESVSSSSRLATGFQLKGRTNLVVISVADKQIMQYPHATAIHGLM